MVAGGLMKRNARFQVFNGVFFTMLLVGGWFYYPLGYFMIFCMLMAMVIGIVKGRWWCDWMCPRGSFWDRYLDIFSLRNKVPSFFRSNLFRLFWLGLLMSMLVVNLVPIWGDIYLMGLPFVMILTVTTVIGLVLGVIYNQRIWCMFCPMGTMANWLGRGRKSLKVSGACTGCGACEEVCRMQIYPGSYRVAGKVQHGDCLKCSYCAEKCPKSALSFEDDLKAA